MDLTLYVLIIRNIDDGLRWVVRALYALEPESAEYYDPIERLADLRCGNLIAQLPYANPESAKWDNRRG